MTVLYCVLAVLLSYALGSVSFAVLISKGISHRDVRKYGSGNAGATNVVRTVGLGAGIATFFLDFAKGAVSAAVGGVAFSALGKEAGLTWLTFELGALFCGAICQIGHIYPLFFDFRGGKGVATTSGILLVADWRYLVIVLIAFLIPFLLTRIISFGSLVAAASLPFAALGIHLAEKTRSWNGWLSVLLCLLMAFAVILRHRENLVRLLKGEEKPIKPRKKENPHE